MGVYTHRELCSIAKVKMSFRPKRNEAALQKLICRILHISDKKYAEILEKCFKKKLFDRKTYEKTGCLTSDGILKRAATVLEKRKRMQKKDKKGDGVSAAETEVIAAETIAETGVSAELTLQSKEKKSIEKERESNHPAASSPVGSSRHPSQCRKGIPNLVLYL